MKKILIVAALAATFAMPAWAKNYAFPAKNPAATIAIPDSWDTEEIDFGFEAKSPDKGVMFFVESTDAKGLDKMMAANTAWMKRNKIKSKGKPIEQDFELGGMKANMVRHEAEDSEGDTIIDFVFIPTSNDRIIMMTLWGSSEERDANAKDLKSISNSIKTIN